MKNNISVV